MFDNRNMLEGDADQAEQLKEFTERSWANIIDEEIKTYGDSDKSWSSHDNSLEDRPKHAKKALEIEIMDPKNEKKFEELAAKNENLKTYKRRHSGNLDVVSSTSVNKDIQSGGDESNDDEEDGPRCKRSTWKFQGERKNNFGQNRYFQRSPGGSECSDRTSGSSSKPFGRGKVELETDPEVLSRRQKQIDFGKNTVGYDNYIQAVDKKDRKQHVHPKTPPKHIKYSRRAWDGLIKTWRVKLHEWDKNTVDENSSSD